MALVIAETMKHNRITKALIDHRNITSVSGGSAEVYNRPKILRLAEIILGIRIAEVINPDHLWHFKFLETICNNFGYKFSVFYDRDTALDWLLS